MVVFAIGLVALGVGRTHDRSGCNAGGRLAFQVGNGKRPVSDAPRAAQKLLDHCRGAQQLTNGVSALVRVKATGPAQELADAAVRREPQRRDSWLALAAVARLKGDQAANRRALARARQLDPLSFRASS
ncbi:hypothetical protein [Conexibacter woesei]|uniref:hypothetical protein n=1 Tax=Conexibacter woesei TaxID=191495 RepID=UPI00047E2699|nr:hypothetical protein [Conexibacter woesei]